MYTFSYSNDILFKSDSCTFLVILVKVSDMITNPVKSVGIKFTLKCKGNSERTRVIFTDFMPMISASVYLEHLMLDSLYLLTGRLIFRGHL